MQRAIHLFLALVSASWAEEICTRTAQTSLEFGNLSGMSDREISAGSSLELKCEVFAAPQARVSWLFNGVAVLSEEGGEFEQVLLGNGETMLGMSMLVARLVIPCATIRHSGTFTCRAENSCHKTIENSATIVVKSSEHEDSCQHAWSRLPATVTLMTESRLETVGAPVQVLCRAVGNPMPTIRWSIALHGTNKFVPVDEYPGFKQLLNGDLLIDSNRLSGDSETLRCTARNRFGVDSFDTSLILLEK